MDDKKTDKLTYTIKKRHTEVHTDKPTGRKTVRQMDDIKIYGSTYTMKNR